MRTAVIGAGAMGASFGGLLARAGRDVTLIDRWAAHVEAIRAHGLRVDWPGGEERIAVTAATPAEAGHGYDAVVVFCHQNDTAWAAGEAARRLAPDGWAVTFQNGLGQLEVLAEALGAARVVGGSTRCSAWLRGPGHAVLSHLDETCVGEVAGGTSARTTALAAALTAAGIPTDAVDDVVARIWRKWTINCAVNPICAATGLRLNEMIQVAELDALQDRVLDEVFAVADAEGVALDGASIRASIKANCRQKDNKPSMLQHLEARRPTEIDALNGIAVARGAAHGLVTPANADLVAIIKGLERRPG